MVAARHDENIKANAAWREKAGFDCFLVRDAGGGCCPWCAAIAGRYKYADAPDDIFRRHDNCTCTVTYECGKMRQDVWSKRTWEASQKELHARKDAAEAAKAIDEQSKPTVNTPEQAKELESKVLDKSGKNSIINPEGNRIQISMQHFGKRAEDFETFFLPKDEYANVMSEIASNLTEEQASKRE